MKEEKNEPKKKSWKVDFIMGIVMIVVGIPFWVTDSKTVGIVMLIVGLFCVISGLCQKVAKKDE